MRIVFKAFNPHIVFSEEAIAEKYWWFFGRILGMRYVCFNGYMNAFAW
jgi:hypothetical protein